jgi:hypothetical protein
VHGLLTSRLKSIYLYYYSTPVFECGIYHHHLQCSRQHVSSNLYQPLMQQIQRCEVERIQQKPAIDLLSSNGLSCLVSSHAPSRLFSTSLLPRAPPSSLLPLLHRSKQLLPKLLHAPHRFIFLRECSSSILTLPKASERLAP